jgi:homoserine dehydrogenase
MSRSILSMLESVLSKGISLVVAASAAAASVGAALVAVALSTAGAFEAEATAGVPSITLSL